MLVDMRRPKNVCYGKEQYLGKELQKILLDPLFCLKDFVNKHVG